MGASAEMLQRETPAEVVQRRASSTASWASVVAGVAAHAVEASLRVAVAANG